MGSFFGRVAHAGIIDTINLLVLKPSDFKSSGFKIWSISQQAVMACHSLTELLMKLVVSILYQPEKNTVGVNISDKSWTV